MKLLIENLPVKPVKMERQFTLVLSEDKARFILDVCRMIGGDPKTTRRRHSAELVELLQMDGKVEPSTNKYHMCRDVHPEHRNITFV